MINKKRSHLLYFLFALITTIIFGLTNPRVQSFFLPGSFEKKIIALIQKAKNQKEIDLKSFWKIRDLQSQSQFVLNPKYIDFYKTYKITKLDPNSKLMWLNEAKIESEDWLVEKNFWKNKILSLETIIQWNNENKINSELLTKISAKPIEKGKTVHQNSNELLIKLPKNKIALIFIKNIDQLKEVNGFFDYTPEEMKLLKDKKWLNITLFDVKSNFKQIN